MLENIKKYISILLVICIIVTNMITGTQIVSAEATMSSASYIGIDTTTKGQWNGVYGEDGYILFGYATSPSEIDVIDGVNYDSDVVSQPSYVDSIDGHAYQMNDRTKIRVAPGYKNDDETILDMPEGSSLPGKVQASAAIGADGTYGGYGGGQRLFTFHLNDDEEHIFTIYSSTRMDYRYFGIKDLEGNELVPLTRGGDLFEIDGLSAAYVSFKVKGSFVFEYGNEWENGLQAVFFDTPQVEAPEVKFGAYLGMDTSTQGAWNGKYGASGYLLVGQNSNRPPNWGYGGDVTDSTKYQIGVSDIFVQPSYVTNIEWAMRNFFSPSPDDHSSNSQVLDLPSGTEGKTKYKAEVESRSDPLTIKVTVNDNQPHIFSTYTSTNWGNGAKVQLLDAAGNLITSSPYIPAGNTFGNGAYVSFMVQGSFQVRFAETGGWASMAGFFFDEPAASVGVPTELSAEATPTGRKINLAWTNAGDYNGVILERSTNNINFSQIATFTGNEMAYTDENLTPDQIYYYRLRNVKGGQYGVSTGSVSATIPPMIETYLEITDMSASNVSVGDSVTVNVHLEEKNSGTAIDGTTVYLKLIGEHVGDGETLGQEIPEFLGTGATENGGNATITFSPQYVGSYGIVAYTMPDDIAAVNGTTSETLSLNINAETDQVAPKVFKLSDAIKPGALFSINGSDINDNSYLKVWIKENIDGTTTYTNATQAEIVQRDKDGRFVVAMLPENAEPGIYNVWVENESGLSSCYKLNVARPLYISDYEIYEGIEIELVGRNFKGSEFGSTDNVKVRLNNGSEYAAIVNLANTNPYKIAFTIGSDIPTGEYFVEASNDGGENWERLAGDQTLSVVEPGENPDPLSLGVAWARDFNWENQFDVTDFGATGGDTSNDTESVQEAVDTAADEGGGVVYFPDGSYYIDTITLPAKVVLLGQSREGTKLYYTNEGPLGINFINSIDVVSNGTAGLVELQGVANLSLLLAHSENPDARPDSFMWLGERWGAAYGNKALRTANRIFVKNVKIDYPTDIVRTTQNGKHDGNSINGVTGGRGIAIEFIGNERMLIQDNHFVGYHAMPFITGWNKYYLLRDNYFEYTFGYVVSLASYFFAENNHVEAVHSEHNAETHGIFGRDNAYMEGNYVKNMGAKDNSHNDGEPLCVEVPNGYWNWGSVLKGTSDSITVAPQKTLTWPSMDYGTLSVLIVEGRGQGQLRKVKLPDGAYPAGESFASYTIEVTEPFDVAPDHTSKFTLIAPNENATFYNNEVVDNAKGIWLFGNSFDGVIANNKSIDSEGIFLWSDGNSSAIIPDYYSRIVNNELTGVSRRSGYGGIGFNTGRSGGRNYFFATDVYSTEILNNKVTGGSNPSAVGNTEAPALNGIYAWAASKASAYDNIDGTRDAVNTLIIGNKLDNLDKGVQISHSNYGAIIQNNTYSETVAAFLNDTHTITDKSVLGVNSIIENNYNIVSSSVSPTTASFDKKISAQADIVVDLESNGNTLTAIKNGTTTLTSETDYTVSANVVTIKKEYLASLPTGTIAVLIFDMDNGVDPTVTITVSDSTPTSGGNDGGSIPAPTPTPVPTASIDIKPILNGSIAEAKVDISSLDKAFDAAKPDVNGVKTVILKVSEISGANEYSQQLPTAAFAQLQQGNTETNRKIQINTPIGSMTVTNNMFDSNDLKKSQNVSLTIGWADASEIDKQLKGKIGNKPVIELKALVEGKVISWNNPNAPVEISIDYKPTAGELKKPDCIVVWYIDGKGKIQSVPTGKYDAATGKVTFTTTHFSKYAIAYDFKTFEDAGKYGWAQKQIEVMASKGIMKGTSDIMFSPTKNISRAEFIDALVKALGLTAKFDTNFIDVSENSAYYDSIGIAKELGITGGTGNNKFSPNAEITRQDMSALVVKAMKLAGISTVTGATSDLKKFIDATKVSDYAIETMATLVQEGILVGSGSKLDPTGKVTKAQTAVIVYKLYNKI